MAEVHKRPRNTLAGTNKIKGLQVDESSGIVSTLGERESQPILPMAAESKTG
jgi:hypothetical protein